MLNEGAQLRLDLCRFFIVLFLLSILGNPLQANPKAFDYGDEKLVASDGALNDVFGESCSMDGDLAIVCAAGDDGGCGAGYIYARTLKSDGSGEYEWIEEAKIVASDRAADDRFGESCSMDGNLVIVGAWRDDGYRGAAYVFERQLKSDGSGDYEWIEEAKLLASDSSGGHQFARSLSISGNLAIVSAPYNGAGSAYVFQRTLKSDGSGDYEWTEEAKITASDGVANDLFGMSSTISGNLAIVGAQGDESYRGAAYVFERQLKSDGSGDYEWIEEAKLVASDGASFDGFGVSASLYDQIAIIGAYNDGDNGIYSGSAFVFKRKLKSDGSGDYEWIEEAKLLASDGAAFDNFGLSVDIWDDHAVSGAYRDGSAYVFQRTLKSDGSGDYEWSQKLKRITNDSGAGDAFGRCVSIFGIRTLVTAPQKNSGVGAAYMFSQFPQQYAPTLNNASEPFLPAILSTTGTWRAEAMARQMVVPNSLHDDNYIPTNTCPQAVAVVDATADGATEGLWEYSLDGGANWSSLASATESQAIPLAPDDRIRFTAVPGFDKGEPSLQFRAWDMTSGSRGVAVDTSSPLNGGETAFSTAIDTAGSKKVSRAVYKTTASDGATNDYFGRSSCLSGDLAIAGAYGHDSSRGAAYVFKRQLKSDGSGDSEWIEEAKLVPADLDPSDTFGSAVSLSGDLAIAGSRLDDDKGSSSGSAYIFKRQLKSDGSGDYEWLQEAKLLASDGAESDRFGFSVSIWGDIAIVGAYGHDSSRGAVYVFSRNLKSDGSGDYEWIEEAKLLASDGAASDLFGFSVNNWENFAVVGAFNDDVKGSAYVFQRKLKGDGSGDYEWVEESKITASDGATDARFGYAVSIYDGKAMVGAYRDNQGNPQSGSAYIYIRKLKNDGSGEYEWVQEAKVFPYDTAHYKYFGVALSIRGDYALVGAYGDDEGGTDAGAAYLFARRPKLGVPGEYEWFQYMKLLMPGGGGYAGYSATLRFERFLVGAHSNNGNVGAAYIVDLDFVNETPQAFDDSPNTNEDSAIDIAVLANDVDPDRDTLSVYSVDGLSAYGVTLSINPNGTISYDPSALTTFQALALGEEIVDSFDYVIRDGRGGEDTGTVYVTVSGVNDPPTDITASSASVVERAGSNTEVGTFSNDDADANDTFTYEFVAGAGDSGNGNFVISGNRLLTAIVFDRSVATAYSIRVRLTDGGGVQVEKIFNITIDAEVPRPLADAGPDQLVPFGSTVRLVGSHSRPRTGNFVSTFWSQLDGPTVTLADASALDTTFTAPTAGVSALTFQLTVRDDSGEDNTDECVVSVSDGLALLPYTHAGADQTVAEGTAVDLQAGTKSPPPKAGETYQWKQVYGPQVQLVDDTTANASFQSPTLCGDCEALEFELTVTEGLGTKLTDSCVVDVTDTNVAPAALAGEGQIVDTGDLVLLDGSDSTDIDGALTYRWRQLFGTPVQLTNPTSSMASFIAPSYEALNTPLVFSLIVKDDGGLLQTDEVAIDLVPSVPTSSGGWGGGGGCSLARGKTCPLNLWPFVLPFLFVLITRKRTSLYR